MKLNSPQPEHIRNTKLLLLQLLQNWAISYGGNFLGALALVGLVAASGAFNEAAAVGPCAIAEYKCHHTWLQASALLYTSVPTTIQNLDGQFQQLSMTSIAAWLPRACSTLASLTKLVQWPLL